MCFHRGECYVFYMKNSRVRDSSQPSAVQFIQIHNKKCFASIEILYLITFVFAAELQCILSQLNNICNSCVFMVCLLGILCTAMSSLCIYNCCPPNFQYGDLNVARNAPLTDVFIETLAVCAREFRCCMLLSCTRFDNT